MQALLRIPKVLAEVEDLRQTSSLEEVFQQYKKNVRIFIDAVKQQVVQLIDRYEQVLNLIKEQNDKLRHQPRPVPQYSKLAPSTFFSLQEAISPVKRRSNQIDMLETAKSKMFAGKSMPITGNLGQIQLSSILKKRQKDDDLNFPVQLISNQPQQHSMSRFESNSRMKKQKERDIIHFLNSGTKSLNATTEKFLQSIGKSKKHNKYEQSYQMQPEDQQNSKLQESGLNQSLGNICASLDKSFVSKQARSLNKKKLNKKEEQAKQKKKKQEEMNRMLKERGVKSILQRLRANVQSSGTTPVQTITNSKLISTGDRAPKTAKVMINPVAVQINRGSSVSFSSRKETPSPGRPQSILKNTKILSSSISAIDFNE